MSVRTSVRRRRCSICLSECVRDVSEPVTAPVRVDIADSVLTATGRFSIKQSAFGIKPISVGGVVAVKDDFSISAKQ
jgi:hypothetical protein